MLRGRFAAINADFTAHVVSGTAPLAVHFDASTTTGGWGVTNPFLQLDYQWDFDDAGAGQWPTYGYTHTFNSKETGYGPIIGHVYESAGTYNVVLTVEDMFGNTDTHTVEINVTAADTTFSGTNTIYIAQTGDFTGAAANSRCVYASGTPSNVPSGVTPELDALVTTLPRILSTYLDDDTRVLLKGGETFTASANTNFNYTEWHLGSFGTGKAIIQAGAATILGGIIEIAGTDGRITDLDIRGNDTHDTSTFGLDNTARRILLQRVDVDGMLLGLSGVWTPPAEHIFIMECDWHDFAAPGGNQSGGGVFMATITGFVMMGTRLENTEYNNGHGTGGATQHVCRCQSTNHSRISDNYLARPADAKATFLFHGPTQANNPNDPATSYNIFCDNFVSAGYFGGNQGPFSCTPQTTAGNTEKTMFNLIFERNFVDQGPYGSSVLAIVANRVIVRNNIFLYRGDAALNPVSMGCVIFRADNTTTHHPCYDVHVYSNTFLIDGVETINARDLYAIRVDTRDSYPWGSSLGLSAFFLTDNLLWTNGGGVTGRIQTAGHLRNNGSGAAVPLQYIPMAVVTNNTSATDAKNTDPGFAGWGAGGADDMTAPGDFIASSPGTDSGNVQNRPYSSIYDIARTRYPFAGRKRGAFA
jgi:PKD repeat protein